MDSWRPEGEDGLALFQHMRAREQKKYLDNCNDDIEEIKYDDGLSTFRISASTPTRGGGLLVLDVEKSDYDWLLTPPGTPLFPSLDQDTTNANFSQRPTLTHSASDSKSSKDPSLKAHSELPSPHRISAASSVRDTPCTYTSPSPQRTKAASPSRTPASSSKAKSPSPSPSSTRSHPVIGAFSPSRSITPTGRSPATASKSTSRSSTPTLCRNNTSPSSAGRPGYLAHKGRRRSLSPRLCPWEPVMAVLSAEPPPNLRRSPSNRSLQRGKPECSGQGITNGSTNKDFCLHHDAKSAIELDMLQNRNKGPKCGDSKYGSPVRRQAQPTAYTKEMISSFANGKLMERPTPHGRNSQNNMFRPLMSSAPAAFLSRAGHEPSNYNIVSPSKEPSTFSPKQNMKVLPGSDCSRSRDGPGHGRDIQKWSIGIDLGKLKNIVNSTNDLPSESHKSAPYEEEDTKWSIGIDLGKLKNIVNSANDLPSESHKSAPYEEEDTKEPMESEAKPEEKTGLACAWDGNEEFAIEHGNDDNTHHTQPLLAHSFSGESQMQNVNKLQSSSRHKFNRDHTFPTFESFSTQALKNCTSAGSPYRTCPPTGSHPVRRQLSMKNADMVYGMWSLKKAESFDISTSDSYSCSESLDSSYVDNHTEKFSEDLSEVDSMSHTGYSLSNSSMTNHSLYRLACVEKPFTEIPKDLGIWNLGIEGCDCKAPWQSPRSGCCGCIQRSLNNVTGGLEAIEPLLECGEKEQSAQLRKQSPASTMMDLAQLPSPSATSQNQSMVHVNDSLRREDVLVCTRLDIKGEHAGFHPVAEDRDGGEGHALTSTFAGALIEDTTAWDDDSMQVQPCASPLKRNVTLEEATDTILFCSSIIHEIVYEAATLGEEKCNSGLEEPTGLCGLISRTEYNRPSPGWRTSKEWSHKRQPECNRIQQTALHKSVGHPQGQPISRRQSVVVMTKNALSSNKDVRSSPCAVGKLEQKRKQKAVCKFGFCCGMQGT